jgi:hypothetical protein
MNPTKKRRLASNNSTGYTGVYKTPSKTFRAQINVVGKMKSLGTYGTSKEAALAYDRAAIHHKFSSSKLNFPDGLPIDDEDYDEIMNQEKKRTLKSNNTSGYIGVVKRGKRYQAQATIDGKQKHLGVHGTAKEAALAYDRVVLQHKLPSAKLNYPDGLPIDDEDYDALMNNPKKKRRRASTNTTGYTGVTKEGKRFKAQIYFDRRSKYLGTYDTPKEAALAYDRAVVQHKLSSSKLNFPNDYIPSTSSEDDDGESDGDDAVLGTYTTPKDKEAALAVDRAIVQHKLSSSKLNFPNGYTSNSEDEEGREEENDDSSSSSSNSYSSHGSDDGKSDDKNAVVEPFPSQMPSLPQQGDQQRRQYSMPPPPPQPVAQQHYHHRHPAAADQQHQQMLQQYMMQQYVMQQMQMQQSPQLR